MRLFLLFFAHALALNVLATRGQGGWVVLWDTLMYPAPYLVAFCSALVPVLCLRLWQWWQRRCQPCR